ncbi:MAG: magnesium transporter CorA family protein [Clostridiales bacterium]|nr:magnesium transporter CorA family protein [Clostridiales bacterium]
MIKIYNTNIQTNITQEQKIIEKGCWINMVSPSENDIQMVCNSTGISDDFIRYALDYEEKARIDIEDDGTILFVLDVPVIEKEQDLEIYTTMPVGLIVVRDDYFITVSLKKNKIISELERAINKKIVTYKKSRFIFQFFYENASVYLRLLKQINKETEIAESILKKTLKNRELLKLLNLEKSLVYFTTSLKANEVVMEKTLRGKIIKLYDEDEDLLEDAIVENKQAIEMSKIYSDILNGSMDAYASIISNNLNGVMKMLTSLTVILAIPTLVASLWGMNVPVPMQNSNIGFYVLIIITIVITIATVIWLKIKDLLS